MTNRGVKTQKELFGGKTLRKIVNENAPKIADDLVIEDKPELKKYSQEALEQILIEAKYYRYIQKQLSQIQKMHEMLKVKIPKDFDFTKVQGLSNEVIEKLQAANPPTLHSASLISGITPAAIEILHVYIKMHQKGKI